MHYTTHLKWHIPAVCLIFISLLLVLASSWYLLPERNVICGVFLLQLVLRVPARAAEEILAICMIRILDVTTSLCSRETRRASSWTSLVACIRQASTRFCEYAYYQYYIPCINPTTYVKFLKSRCCSTWPYNLWDEMIQRGTPTVLTASAGSWPTLAVNIHFG